VACRDLTRSVTSASLLRRPFSIAAIAAEPDLHRPIKEAALTDSPIYFELIYRIMGPGTTWLAQRSAGQTINLLGPLGNGFTLPKHDQAKVILIGGGVGLPPLLFLAQRLNAAGFKNVVGFAGARSQDLFAGNIGTEKYHAARPLQPQMIVEQFTRSAVPSIIATDDGSCGFAGSIVEAADLFLEHNGDRQDAHLYVCGPAGMLKAAADLAQRRNLPCQVCLEAYMACGIGVCQTCAVRVRTGQSGTESPSNSQYKLVCTNGPVFDSRKILW